MSLKSLAIHIRAMDLYYHACHNLVKGTVFYQDHEAFGEYYKQLSSDYDMVIERAINKEGRESADLKVQLKEVYQKIKELPCFVKENKEYFVKAMELEKELCSKIDGYIKQGCSAGTEQLIGDIANRSETRQYLINQRLM
jgi:DNA-binding ferritin-like protein